VLIVIIKPNNNNSVYEKDWFWANKTYPFKKFDIVIYGDSRVYRGISPEVFSKYFPSSDIINLGYSSGGINKEALEFAFEKLGQQGVKILILGITPYSLTVKARQNKHLKQEFNRPVGEVLQRKYVYPLLTAFEPININPFSNQQNYQMKYNKSGWVASYKIKEDTTEAFNSYINQFSKTKISDKSIEELKNFIKNKTKEGVLIFGFYPPSTYTMEKIEKTYTMFNEADIKNIFISNGAKWIEIKNRFQYHSYDGSHLDYISAKKLSEFLASQLKKELINNQSDL
jgi:hypothetical protein